MPSKTQGITNDKSTPTHDQIYPYLKRRSEVDEQYQRDIEDAAIRRYREIEDIQRDVYKEFGMSLEELLGEVFTNDKQGTETS